jgi:hypothetical protein
MPKRTVLFDSYNWLTPIEGQPGKSDFNSATRGQVIDVTQAEADRGEALGALGDAGELAILDAEAASSEGGLPDDAVLEAYNVDDLLAYLSQHPADVDRVEALEAKRGAKARVTVTRAITSTRELLAAEIATREAAAEQDALEQAAALSTGSPVGLGDDAE